MSYPHKPHGPNTALVDIGARKVPYKPNGFNTPLTDIGAVSALMRSNDPKFKGLGLSHPKLKSHEMEDAFPGISNMPVTGITRSVNCRISEDSATYCVGAARKPLTETVANSGSDGLVAACSFSAVALTFDDFAELLS